MSLSRAVVSGRIRNNPEKKTTSNNTAVTNFLLEVTYLGRGAKAASHTIRVNTWREQAEQIEKAFKAGDRVVVTGRLQLNVYTTSEGKKKRELEIEASSVIHLTNLTEIESLEASGGSEESSENSSKPDEVSDFNEVINSTEEIPF